MATTAENLTYVLKEPGTRAVPITLPGGTTFVEEVYRIIGSAEGNPPGRKGAFGDMPYPEQFDKPDLRVSFDDEFGLKPLKLNCWGVKGAILIARLESGQYTSLRPEEIESVITDLEREPARDINDWEQKIKDLGKHF